MLPTTKRTHGFTLIELIIVVVVLGIMAAALVPLMATSIGAYNAIHGDIIVLDKQRYAIERLAREIREVSYDQASSSFAFTGDLAGMGDHQMAFTRQFVFSVSGGVAASATAAVTIGTDGNTVTLGYDDGTANVLTDQLKPVTGLTFTYFTQSGVASSPTDVRAVGIDLTLTHEGRDYAQTTRVELKNYAK